MVSACYMFTINDCRAILTDESSSVGYSYPRIFIEVVPEESYVNYDISLNQLFGMTSKDFSSWIDGKELRISIHEVVTILNSFGLNGDAVIENIKTIVNYLKPREENHQMVFE